MEKTVLLEEIREYFSKKIDEVLEDILNECNPIIRVDRTIRPSYPDFVEEVKYLELELTGPSEFDVTKLECYRHPKQVDGYATGNEIYEELIAKKMLEGCLGLADLQAIQARGIRFFRRHSLGNMIFGWKSVVLRGGKLNVPCLYGSTNSVEVYFIWLGVGWDSGHPTLRYARQ